MEKGETWPIGPWFDLEGRVMIGVELETFVDRRRFPERNRSRGQGHLIGREHGRFSIGTWTGAIRTTASPAESSAPRAFTSGG